MSPGGLIQVQQIFSKSLGTSSTGETCSSPFRNSRSSGRGGDFCKWLSNRLDNKCVVCYRIRGGSELLSDKGEGFEMVSW